MTLPKSRCKKCDKKLYGSLATALGVCNACAACPSQPEPPKAKSKTVIIGFTGLKQELHALIKRENNSIYLLTGYVSELQECEDDKKVKITIEEIE